MLQFYYDCIDFYFDRSDFEYQEMDTDFAYMAFSCEKPFEEYIKHELRDHFEQHKYEWFPRDYNKKVAAFDRRTPGLFKEEWRGDAMVSLSSKNYICYLPDERHKVKVSAKGVEQGGGRNKDVLNLKGFETVVRDRTTLQGTNKGFRLCKNTKSIITYTQQKTALNYCYDKRRVLEDDQSLKNWFDKMDELLHQLYYNPKTGYVGAQALYQKAKELNPKITMKVVKNWYDKQTDISTISGAKEAFRWFKITSRSPPS
ncbi:hypothetical protein F442_19711 [Phytophthora nicotianae P10297]|uniref:Uncharacterized protein n=1 Tax=Phytophthora nicotianae P10297 TaxID=1317064 RepID=W2Y8U6_PHYNI|nr:hypothetical protein F442_19711 [Phytophthora nicotianae P10297]